MSKKENYTGCRIFVGVIFIILLLLLIFKVLLEIQDRNLEKNYQEEFWKEQGETMICWDGCFNMLELMLGEVDYYNETQKEFYDECVLQCDEQHMNFPYDNIDDYKNKHISSNKNEN